MSNLFRLMRFKFRTFGSSNPNLNLRLKALPTIAVALICLLTWQGSPARAQSLEQQLDDFLPSRLDDICQNSNLICDRGVGLLLVHKGEVIYRAYFGELDEDSVVPIASATKWLSAAVIMSLVDDGLIDLDEPIATYLPQFTGDKAAITTRQLFSHTSGLPGGSDGCQGERQSTLEACTNEIAGIDLVAAPGSELRYGGRSMQVAGRIAEVVTGQSWDELFTDRIAEPLAMTSTDYNGAFAPTDNPRIAGGARSSLDDYGSFMRMLRGRGMRDGVQVLSADAVDIMLRDQTGGAAIVESPWMGFSDIDPSFASIRYGIGNWGERMDADSGVFIEASSQGAFGFSPWVDRERDLVGVLLVRSPIDDVVPVYLELKQIVRDVLDAEASSIEDDFRVMGGVQLLPAFPNPSTGGATITFSLDLPAHVSLEVFDPLGRRVREVAAGWRSAGTHQIRLDLTSHHAGTYFVRLQSGAVHAFRPISLVR